MWFATLSRPSKSSILVAVKELRPAGSEDERARVAFVSGHIGKQLMEIFMSHVLLETCSGAEYLGQVRASECVTIDRILFGRRDDDR